MLSKTEIIEGIKGDFLLSSELIKKSILLSDQIYEVINKITSALESGNKIILFGNGGSATDAQHIATEFLGRFKIERNSIPAICLTDNTSLITALLNDYSSDIIFSRQCSSLISKNDVVIAISTSGNSENVRLGLIESKKYGAYCIGLLGNNGGKIKNLTDLSIVVPSTDTAKIQEVHRVIYHIICDHVEQLLK
jgi:D-sedoheptulose 7-phosphate isomerase